MCDGGELVHIWPPSQYDTYLKKLNVFAVKIFFLYKCADPVSQIPIKMDVYPRETQKRVIYETNQSSDSEKSVLVSVLIKHCIIVFQACNKDHGVQQ